jgi:hypothetical protein
VVIVFWQRGRHVGLARDPAGRDRPDRPRVRRPGDRCARSTTVGSTRSTSSPTTSRS